jgi:hypothetical protein
MSKDKGYRIINLRSFEEATKQPRQIAGLYFYQTLDCLVDLAHEVSTDFRKRPELYRNLDQPSIAATLAKLNAEYGTQVTLPSRRQRTEIFVPIFGQGENSAFVRARDCLLSAVKAYAECAATGVMEMLRENVRTALGPFKNYLSTLQGDSVNFSKETVLSELTEKICYPVLRNHGVATVFGIAKRAALEYPYATDSAADLLVEAISTQSKSEDGSSISIRREGISNLQRVALLGTQAIATAIDFDEAKGKRTDADLDLLITTWTAWGTALVILKPSPRSFPTPSAQEQRKNFFFGTQRTVAAGGGSAKATQAAMPQRTVAAGGGSAKATQAAMPQRTVAAGGGSAKATQAAMPQRTVAAGGGSAKATQAAMPQRTVAAGGGSAKATQAASHSELSPSRSKFGVAASKRKKTPGG